MSEIPLFPSQSQRVSSAAYHQQPDVNYIQVLEKVDFPRMVTLTGSPFKGNQLKAGTGKIVHFWLLVEPRGGVRPLHKS